MVAARNKLSTKYDGSVFYHVLENEETDTSAVEETHERNFRDLSKVNIDARMYVHHMLYLFSFIQPLERFLIFKNPWHLPEVDNIEEERMLEVFSPHYYYEPNVQLYSYDEMINGEHFIFNLALIEAEYKSFLDDENEAFLQSFFIHQ
jgi:hypothetical protein